MLMFTTWIIFAAGIIVLWLAKKLFQFILTQKLPEDDIKVLTPIWAFWDLLCVMISGAFVLLFYIGKLFS
ncbi:hypothetical protein QMA40_20970 [Bacillus thuringiensis]|uniref:hypothetical protein n=1 Tax=Bacillus thuringiensis TaxID=1428 RepID=UPI003977B24C